MILSPLVIMVMNHMIERCLWHGGDDDDYKNSDMVWTFWASWLTMMALQVGTKVELDDGDHAGSNNHDCNHWDHYDHRCNHYNGCHHLDERMRVESERRCKLCCGDSGMSIIIMMIMMGMIMMIMMMVIIITMKPYLPPNHGLNVISSCPHS